ncbi:geranylgeranylglycerol-phosphate geranylgeranyltransferase [Methanohalobium sp.]|uniref:geranylgeranylglycerol-phosphate geranylgeranyltransferase n=1 Tax=Methanohalobium sp. TaxID=2837493 RepID=UPI0025E74C3A|nr:geranylgeranylglycerol-phosphate geranylgeranyltransferase [Methanohalobium sp.]
MRAYIQLIRYGNCAMAAIAAVIGVFIAFNILNPAFLGYSFVYRTLSVFFVVFFVTGAGNAINDYFDYEIDAVNKPSRPIPSGRIGLSKAFYFSLTLFIIGVVIAFTLNWITGIIALFNSLVLIYYAKSLKRKAFSGNLSIGYLTGSTFLFGGAVYGISGLYALMILFILATLATTSREIVKDIEDIKGDEKEKASTLPIQIGVKKSAYIASFIGLIAIVSSPLPYILSLLGINYLYIVALADIFFIVAIVEIVFYKNASMSSKLFKIAMMFALISFIAGSL